MLNDQFEKNKEITIDKIPKGIIEIVNKLGEDEDENVSEVAKKSLNILNERKSEINNNINIEKENENNKNLIINKEGENNNEIKENGNNETKANIPKENKEEKKEENKEEKKEEKKEGEKKGKNGNNGGKHNLIKEDKVNQSTNKIDKKNENNNNPNNHRPMTKFLERDEKKKDDELNKQMIEILNYFSEIYEKNEDKLNFIIDNYDTIEKKRQESMAKLKILLRLNVINKKLYIDNEKKLNEIYIDKNPENEEKRINKLFDTITNIYEKEKLNQKKKNKLLII